MSDKWLSLDGKVIIVTGGSVGIGGHVTSNLVKNGAQVINFDLHSNDEQNESVYFIQGDVTNPDDVKRMANETIENFGRIDGLVNNAGVNRPKLLVDYYNGDPEHEFNVDDFDFTMNVNAKGVFLCAQAAARVMIKQKSGVIINITSEAGMEGSVGQSIYSASKAAVNGFTLSWAKELGRFNIRVVGVAPGINEPTPMGNPAHVEKLAYTRGVKAKDISPDYQKIIPLGRRGKLEEIADLISYLQSDHASYISGTTVNVTGGKSRG